MLHRIACFCVPFSIIVLVASTALAGSVTGDEFTVTASENEVVFGMDTVVAGDSAAMLGGDATLEWLDGDSFELDFFFSGGVERFDTTFSVTGLDFMNGGLPEDIVGVTEASAEFGQDYQLSFDAHSITVVFPFLDGFEAADGEIIVFDVTTAPPLVSILGDEFTATVSEGGFELGTDTVVAGAAAAMPVADTSVDWTDRTTFELDFFFGGAVTDLTFALTDLDFAKGGQPEEIVGVTEVQSEFGWNYQLSFDAHSITIVYPALDEGQAGDGEIIVFDVTTAPEPGQAWLVMTAFATLLVVSRFRSGEPASIDRDPL